MIISLSGSQGQGKTTVLSTLSEHSFKVIERKTSRSILTEWNLTLNEVNKYPPLTKNFQEEIIERHFQSMEPFIGTDEIVFMERSFADIFAYALYALGSYNEYDSWMNRYYERCMEYQQFYDQIFYLTGRKITPEEDGVRSTNKHFATSVDREIHSLLIQMDEGYEKLCVIDSPNHEHRINIILGKLVPLCQTQNLIN